MKTQIIVWALLLCLSALKAQTNEKKTTIRVKKIETVNGVEKISDTTYTIDGPFKLDSNESDKTKIITNNKPPKNTFIVTEEINNADIESMSSIKDSELNNEIEKAMKSAGIYTADINAENIAVMDLTQKSDSEKSEKKITKVIIIKKINLSDPSPEETHFLTTKTGTSDNLIAIDQLSCYPNPSNGKFKLTFNLKTKGLVEIHVYHSDGKSVYSEKIPNFSGTYSNDIDISSQTKGIYFVKIEQGGHAQLKKLILE